MFEEFIWYFTDRPCKYCADYHRCNIGDGDTLDGNEMCVLRRLSEIVVDGFGDCWVERKSNNET